MTDRGRRGGWWKQTRAERESYRNTLNLFFGALLGANLGSLGGLSVSDYLHVLLILLGVVMTLQLVTAARSRSYLFMVSAMYGVTLAMAYESGTLKPTAMPEADFAKLAATLALWIGAAILIELTPTLDDGA